jgi:hypothetical protein
MQAGMDDEDLQREAAQRREHTELADRERTILLGLGLPPDPQVESAFRRVDAVEGLLDIDQHNIDVLVGERVSHIRVVLDQESGNLHAYRASLATMEGESEEVVGAIALANYRDVRQRFYDLVLRADVGTIDVSWAVREEHRMRGEALSRQRARDLKSLEDEFRDITDQRESAP